MSNETNFVGANPARVVSELTYKRCWRKPPKPLVQDPLLTVLQRYLTTSTDWIVLNVTMDVLTQWAARDAPLTAWLEPQLERLRHDERKSVAKRAEKRRSELAR